MRTHRRAGGVRDHDVDAVLLTEQQKLRITRCMLMGCVFVYGDFGHPERAPGRKYHTCRGPEGVVGYGHDEAEAAYDWLKRTGYINRA